MESHKDINKSKDQKPFKNKKNLSIKIPTAAELKRIAIQRKRQILGIRATEEQLFIQDYQIKAIKTSILIDHESVPEALINANIKSLNQILSHRPIEKIKSLSEMHSPVEVLTSKGSSLFRVSKIGGLSIFSNDMRLKPIITSETTLSEMKEKSHEVDILLHKLKERDQVFAKNRETSQNQIMKMAATSYVNKTHLFQKELTWEWLHLVAYSIAGKDTQDKNNLVAGSESSNTEMMFAESMIRYLAHVYPEGFKLLVKATLIPETQIATSIHYAIKTKDFEIPFIFNAQTKNKPHVNYQKYFNFIIKELVRCTKNAKYLKNKTSTKSNIFYSKKELANSDIPIIHALKEEKKEITQSPVLPKKVVVIDTETTGLYVDLDDRVVEVGAVEMIDGKLTGKEFRQIIDPERDIPKELHEKNIHHITNAVVNGKPKFKDIADNFLHFIDQAILIGHNLPFDLGMLENELKLANRKETLADRYGIDTKNEAKKISSEKNIKYPSHSLDALCKYYHIDLSERANGHGALIDAKLTGQLFHKLKEEKESDHYKSMKLN